MSLIWMISVCLAGSTAATSFEIRTQTSLSRFWSQPCRMSKHSSTPTNSSLLVYLIELRCTGSWRLRSSQLSRIFMVAKPKALHMALWWLVLTSHSRLQAFQAFQAFLRTGQYHLTYGVRSKVCMLIRLFWYLVELQMEKAGQIWV